MFRPIRCITAPGCSLALPFSRISGVTFAAALLSIALSGCSSGSSSSTSTGGGGTPTPTAPTAPPSVFVIQFPSTPLPAGSSASILQFSATATGSATPTATITAPASTLFEELATDSAYNVYTSSITLSTATGTAPIGDVRAYALGATGAATPVRTLPGYAAGSNTKIGAVDGVAVSSTGQVYLGLDSGAVEAFSATAAGNVAPDRYILGASQTGGGASGLIVSNAVAADSTGQIYVVNEGGPGLMPIAIFAPTATGNIAPARQIGGALTTLASVTGITTDATGNLYVTNNASTGGSIVEFAPTASGNVAPIRTITGTATTIGTLYGIKVDSSGNIFVVSATNAGKNPTVLRFAAAASGNVAPVSSFTSTAWTQIDYTGSIALY